MHNKWLSVANTQIHIRTKKRIVISSTPRYHHLTFSMHIHTHVGVPKFAYIRFKFRILRFIKNIKNHTRHTPQ